MGAHHQHTKTGDSTTNLRLAFVLNVSFTLIEIVGGWYTNSVAILSDAIHDLGDSIAIGSALFLEKKSAQTPSPKFPYGYQRLSLLSALINCSILLLGSIFIFFEAVERLRFPEPTNTQGMLVFAFLGVLMNGYAAWKVHGGKTLNEKVIALHLLEDVMGWAAILVGALILQFVDLVWLDPVLSLGIMLLILRGVVLRLRETIHLFLQGVPKKLQAVPVQKQLEAWPEIDKIKHLRIWSLDGEAHVCTATVVLVQPLTEAEQQTLKKKLENYFETLDCKEITLAFSTTKK